MGGCGGYYAQWNKTEKDKYGMVSLICGILKEKKKLNLQNQSRKVVAGEGREGRVKGYTVNKVSGANVNHGDYNW